ncbi:MAG TPA: copper homeostasis protein CutC [Gemmatimonadales bacterium]
MTILIEAAVQSVDAALAAAEGGAHRIELCTDLAHGGTTPDVKVLRACRSQLLIPIFVLVRPRAGDFVYSAAEHDDMLEQVVRAKHAGARGIVTGALTAQQEIDQVRTHELIDAARPLPVTFHRAFDACLDLAVALQQLINLGVERVLTSGGAPTALEGAARISRLVIQTDDRIGILAGGGINATNVAQVVHDTGVREVHFSVRDAEKVRNVTRALVINALKLPRL